MQPCQNKIDGNRIDLRQTGCEMGNYLCDQITKMVLSKSNSAYDDVVLDEKRQIEPT